MSTSSTTLAELCISIAAKAWQKDGEILATGIGLIPRLAVGLSKLHFNKDLLMLLLKRFIKYECNNIIYD